MDTLDSMAIFVEIADRRSLTAAAEAVGKSLPTVVRTLAGLEAKLGVRLFNRTTRRVAITDEGRIYLEHCRRIQSAVEESEQAISQTLSEPSGLITVTASVLFGEMHIAPQIADFLVAFPKIEVRLLLLDRIADLLEEGIDVAVRIAPLQDSTLIARRVGQIRQVICASPRLLAQAGKPLHPKELSTLPCVRAPGIGDISTWRFQEDSKQIDIDVHGRLICNNVGSSIVACTAGCGFGRFLCYQVMPAVQRGELEIVLPAFEPAPRPLSLIYAQGGLRTARLRTFVDWFAKGLSESVHGAPRMDRSPTV
jgi:DNA-binding transcriptional LysR family regulator